MDPRAENRTWWHLDKGIWWNHSLHATTASTTQDLEKNLRRELAADERDKERERDRERNRKKNRNRNRNIDKDGGRGRDRDRDRKMIRERERQKEKKRKRERDGLIDFSCPLALWRAVGAAVDIYIYIYIYIYIRRPLWGL